MTQVSTRAAALSSLFVLCPFYEQAATYEAGIRWMGLNAPTGQWPDSSPGGATISGTFYANPFADNLSALACPSEQYVGKPFGYGVTNYCGSIGDWIDCGVQGTNTNVTYKKNPRGVFSVRDRPAANYTESGTNFSALNDGTSNTIIFTECTLGGSGNGMLKQAKVGIQTSKTAVVNPRGTVYVTDAVPNDCMLLVSGGQWTTAPHAESSNLKNSMWALGRPIHTAVSTILPPNGPSCHTTEGHSSAASQMKSAGSYHTGGVNVALLDGSVRFVNETISWVSSGYTAANARIVVSGPSQFGIWGAMGSIDGGESVALP